jgi:ABC-type Na+ efflux pump permease subunit
MIGDLRTMLWKEWRERVREPRRPLSAFQGMAVLMVGFGIWFAFRERDFITGWGPVAVAFTGGMLVLLFAADAFAGERERRTLEALYSTPLGSAAILLGKVVAAGAQGWVLGALYGVTAGVSLTLMGVDLGPMWRGPALAGAVAFSVGLALFFATIGCVVSCGSATVVQAQQKLFLAVAALMIIIASLLTVGPFFLARQIASPPEFLILGIQSLIQTLRGWTPAMGFLAATAALLLLTLAAFGVGLRSVRSQRSQPG